MTIEDSVVYILLCGAVCFLALITIVQLSHNHHYTRSSPKSLYDSCLGASGMLKGWIHRPTLFLTFAAVTWQCTASLYFVYHGEALICTLLYV